MTSVAAIICILFGFVSGFVKEPLLFDSLTWFVAALAFNTLAIFRTLGPFVTSRGRVVE
jgi:hypothetical protein